MGKMIYLDNASTTKVYKEVLTAMDDVSLNKYGNASSPHIFGDQSQQLLNASRAYISKEINAKPEEVIFTSGATESNNQVLFGLASAHPLKNKIIISSFEHDATYIPALELEKRGYKVVKIKVDKQGLIDLNDLNNQIDSKTLVVSIIHVHNEIGVIQDINKIGEICKQKNVLFHLDSSQAFGKLDIDVKKSNIDLLSASAHKIGGPKGIGLLFIKEGTKINPIIYGGGQEYGFRSGTENIAGIVGFAKALDITKKVDKMKIKKLRDYFITQLEKIGCSINGSKDKRIYNNLNVNFNGKDSEMLVAYLSSKGIMCSARSACNTKHKNENRVLNALGLSKDESKGSLRFVLNEFITKNDLDYTVKQIINGLKMC
jgi:cysteine desulfurase